MRTYWLSFADASGFLGAVVVDVSEAFHAEILPELRAKFPKMTEEGGWIAAATRVARDADVNPGGQVLAQRLDDGAFNAAQLEACPRNTLLDHDACSDVNERLEALRSH